MKKPELVSISPEAIAPMVHWLRHEKIMLDSDLAELYGVPTKVLNQAVKRNADRFPADFMFQITEEEMEGLRCQTGILKGPPPDDNRSQFVTGSEVQPSRSQIVILKNGGDSEIPMNSSQTVMSPTKNRGRRYLP